MRDVRGRFPALSRRFGGRPLVYLDSAATALKPDVVIEAERRFLESGAGNIHRGKHALSEEASEAWERARDRVASFLNAGSAAEVVFVRNTTEALNVVAHGLRLGRHDEVVACPLEHHSNLLPWMARAQVVFCEATPFEPVRVEAVERALTPASRVLVIGHASNVTGLVQPVADLCRFARERGLVSVVDAAQSAAHLRLDVQALGCDALAFSGHKLYGPTGIGVLWGRQELLERLEPLLFGGGMVDRVTRQGFTLRRLPHRLEAGTPHVSGAVGLAAALDFLDEVGRDEVATHAAALADELVARVGSVPGLRALHARAQPRLPIITFALDGLRLSADEVAVALSDRAGVMVRSGFHCAHPLFASVGLDAATFRASGALYTTSAELDAFAEALERVLRPFRPPTRE